MVFFSDKNTDSSEEAPDSFTKWREARRERRKALAHERALADAAKKPVRSEGDSADQ